MVEKHLLWIGVVCDDIIVPIRKVKINNVFMIDMVLFYSPHQIAF